MGVKNLVKKAAQKAGDAVSDLSVLSLKQIEKVQQKRESYLLEMPDPHSAATQERTNRLLAASSIEIFNAYLSQIKELYLPVESSAEYDSAFDSKYNIRYFNITKWVTDKNENNLEKLVNVYAVLSNEDCNIALVFNRTCNKTNVYLGVCNNKNANSSVEVNDYKERLKQAIRGNFPGSEWKDDGIGILPCLNNDKEYSVATASNIPTEKSEKFISQTIEKLLDGIIPKEKKEEYTIILLATPIQDVEERKLIIGEFYSGLAPYASWSTDYHYTENNSESSSATMGVNVGASAGIQNGNNYATTNADGVTENEQSTKTESYSETDTKGYSQSNSKGNTHSISDAESLTQTEGTSDTLGANANIKIGEKFGIGANYSHGINSSTSNTETKSITDAASTIVTKVTSNSFAKTTGNAMANSLGKAVSKTVSKTAGTSKATSFGANFGANFARSSTVTAMIGKNEGITQTFTNYNIKHTLELLESQMKRLEQSTALGMWDFAAYVLSEDQHIANNVAHSYLALTLGEESYMTKSAINLWRGSVKEEKNTAKEICEYLREFRHPVFALNPKVIEQDEEFTEYPTVVTATTSLSGKELAYSLNFPKKSVAGLPVLECAEFGRNIITYRENNESKKITLGNIFHMNHAENNTVELEQDQLTSHVFITGSTGSGKSNTIYQLLSKTRKNDCKFLVVEPAKGEYKNVFGNDTDVAVYGTNPKSSDLLKINPFSFPSDIHVLEHIDRLVEIFNVCWPMYAAMPAVLKQAVEKSYSDCGWNLVASTNKYGEELFPDFSDVCRNVREIIDNSEYDSDNKGAYKGSLLTRLQSLTTGLNAILFSSDEISNEELFDNNAIVDLSRVGSTETKSLIMGLLVMKLQEYRMTSGLMNAKLKHITVLEEAHNLLKKTSSSQALEGSSLVGKSVEMLANAIAEMRTYGEGFIIADQAPGLLDKSVIRNTNTKISMRLPNQEDRVLVGKSANLNDDQITELAKLPCGVAAVYQNEWIQPVLCQIEKYNKEFFNYKYDLKEKILDNSKEISKSLLDSIMNQELMHKSDKQDLKEMKDIILKSRLDTIVKTDFLDYIDTKEDFESLRSLLYDLLNAKEAINKSIEYDGLEDWLRNVVDSLEPSIKNYSAKQINLAMALILSEQARLDISYKDIYLKFTELNKKVVQIL